jgi:hypothetical protein
MGDSSVQCKTCGKSESVDFAHCLQHGWPECCGKTMTLLDTTADVTGIMEEVMTGKKLNAAM